MGLGYEVSGLGYEGLGLGCAVLGLGYEVLGLKPRSPTAHITKTHKNTRKSPKGVPRGAEASIKHV